MYIALHIAGTRITSASLDRWARGARNSEGLELKSSFATEAWPPWFSIHVPAQVLNTEAWEIDRSISTTDCRIYNRASGREAKGYNGHGQIFSHKNPVKRKRLIEMHSTAIAREPKSMMVSWFSFSSVVVLTRLYNSHDLRDTF